MVPCSSGTLVDGNIFTLEMWIISFVMNLISSTSSNFLKLDGKKLSPLSGTPLRGWSSIIRGQKGILSRWLFYENLEKYKHIGGMFSSFMVRKVFFDRFENISLTNLYFFIKIYQFLKNHNTIYKKTGINLNKTFLGALHGLIS